MSKITGDGSLYLKERAAADSDVSGEGQLWVSSADNLPQFTTKDGDDTPLMSGNIGKNVIIGGDFTVNPWQRGTSFTTTSDGTFTADRFEWLQGTHGGAQDVLKTADAPTVAQAGVYTQHCLHVDVTTLDSSIGASQYAVVRHIVEGLNAARFGFGQAGTRYVTLSFWHKHTKTGTHSVVLKNSANTRSYAAEYTQAVTDTWEKADLTIPVDTSGTWLYTNGVGIQVFFALAVGSTFQTTAGSWVAASHFASSNQVNNFDSASNNFKIALVQLEAGPVATQFESRDAGTELALCQRYLWAIREEDGSTTNPYVCVGYINGTTTITYVMAPPVVLRTIPTLTMSNAAHYQSADSGTVRNLTTLAIAGQTSDRVIAFTGTGSGLTTGNVSLLRIDGTAGAYLWFDAEL